MARKLNTKLIAGIVVVAAAGGTALVVGPKLLRPSVEKLVAQGDAAAAAGDYDQASFLYGRAAGRAGNDIGLQLKFVDALEYTVKGDPEKFRNLRAVQAQVLTNDPRNVEALRHVLAYQKRDVQDVPQEPSFVRSLAGTAERLLQLVPGDRDARLALVTATFEPYARNLEVKPEDVEKQRDAAEKLFFEKPDDGQPLRQAVQFRLLNAAHNQQNGDKAAAADEIAKAQALCARAQKAAPGLADAWMSGYETARASGALVDRKDTAKVAALNKEVMDALTRANDLAKPADVSFLATRGLYLHFQELIDPKKAEAGYRKLLEELPDDRQPRIMLAEFLARQPSRRDDALAVLDRPFKPTKPPRALESRTQHVQQLIESVRRASIGLVALEAVTDPAERQKRVADLTKQYQNLSSDPEVSVLFKSALLRIAGGLQYAQGELAKSVATLNEAAKQMNPDSQSAFEQDTLNDTLMAYAQAELRLGQTGQARPALQQLVQRRPENIAARLVLTDVLLGQRDVAAAQEQMTFLTRFFPGVPVVEQLRLRLMSQQGDLKSHYKDLAEATRDQRLLKVSAAGTLNDADEVIRLAKLMLADTPGDPQATTVLAQAYAQTNRRPEAVVVVNDALRAKPDDKRLQQLRDALAAETPADRTKLVDQQIGQMADPYARAMARADLARQQGRPDDAIKLYQEAEKLKPDGVTAYDAHFLLLMAANRFADADALLKDLVRLNADQTGGALYRLQLASARALAEPDADRRSTAFKAVLGDAQQVAQQNRELATASLVYAKLLQQSGAFAEAADQFGQTLDKSPTNREALIGSANCLLALDRRTEARQRIDAAAAQAPNEPAVRELQLAYDLRFGDPEKAIATLQAQSDQRPDDAQAVARLGVALEQVAASRAKDNDAAAAKGLFGRAADVYGRAAAKFPQDLRFLSAYANTLQRLGRKTEAEAAVERVANLPENQSRPEVGELLAAQYVASGKADDAVRVLSGVIDRVKPAPVSAVQRLAVLLARSNRLPDALNVLDLRKDDPAVQRQRVELLVAARDLNGARQAIDTALAATPTADTYLLAASVEMQAGDMAKAEGFLGRVFQERPNDATALFYRGQIKGTKTPPDLDGARDDLARARDLVPSALEVRLALADVYGRRRERDAQVGELQKAWDLNHQSKAALLKLAQAYASATPPQWGAVGRVLGEAKADPTLAADADVRFLEADAALGRGDGTAARAAAKAALDADPKNPNLLQRYFDLLVRAKAYDDVLADSQPVLAEQKDAWWLYRLRGLAQAGRGDKAAAAKELEAAFNTAQATGDGAAIEPVVRAIASVNGAQAAVDHVGPLVAANPGYGVLAGSLYLEAGDYDHATVSLNAALADPKTPGPLARQARQMLGAAYLQMTPPNAVAARPVFEALIKDAPDDVSSLNNLACVLLLPDSTAKPADALPVAEKAYNLVSGSSDTPLAQTVTDTYGWSLIKAGQAQKGIDLLRGIAETARFPDVHLHLAEAYLDKADLDDAEASLADAKRRLAENARRGQKVDPTSQAKYDRLAADLDKRRKAAG